MFVTFLTNLRLFGGIGTLSRHTLTPVTSVSGLRVEDEPGTSGVFPMGKISALKLFNPFFVGGNDDGLPIVFKL